MDNIFLLVIKLVQTFFVRVKENKERGRVERVRKEERDYKRLQLE